MKKKLKSILIIASFISVLQFSQLYCVTAINFGEDVSIPASTGDAIIWNADIVGNPFLFDVDDKIRMIFEGTNTTGDILFVKARLDAIDNATGAVSTLVASGSRGIGVNSSDLSLICASGSDLTRTGFLGMIPTYFNLTDLGVALNNSNDWDGYSIDNNVLNLTNSLEQHILLIELSSEGFISNITAYNSGLLAYSASFVSFIPHSTESSILGYELAVLIGIIGLVSAIIVSRRSNFSHR